MSLTAKEWLLLPKDEQLKRGNELSPHECFLLRTVYSYVHFSEEEKMIMTEEEKNEFLNAKKEMSEFDKIISNMTIDQRIEYLFEKNKN